MGWCEGPLLGFDFETTGVDPCRDRPVQVALAWTLPGRAGRIDTFLIDPGCAIPEEAVSIHGITTERARREGCSLAEAARRVRSALAEAAATGVPVVAMNAGFDLTVAETLFAREGLPPLEWRRVIDPLVMDRHVDRYRTGRRRLEALCGHYGVRLTRPHDAGADAVAAVLISRTIGWAYPQCGQTAPGELTRRQRSWHRSWAAGYDSWRQEQGLPLLREEEYSWPCRPRPRPVS
jgi:DNA polymerase-3 subunit epsilon